MILIFFRRMFAFFVSLLMISPGYISLNRTMQPAAEGQKATDKERAIQLAESYYQQYFWPTLQSLTVYPFSKQKGSCWDAIGLVSLTARMAQLDCSYEKLLKPVLKTLNHYRKELDGTFAGYVVPWWKDGPPAEEIGIAYDDNMWLGRDFVALYEQTKEENYRTLAKEVGDFLLDKAYVDLPASLFEAKGLAIPDGPVCGFYWDYRVDAVHTCSTGPASQFFAALYRITNEQKYLDAAQASFRLLPYLENENGTFHDLIRFEKDEQNNITAISRWDRGVHTYNSGSPITAAVELYRITEDPAYLDAARHWAACADEQFASPTEVDGVWTYPAANIWFHLILLNGFTALQPYEPAVDDYIARFRSGLDYAYKTHRTKGYGGVNENLLPRDFMNGFQYEDEYNHYALEASAAAELYALLSLSGN